MHTLYFFKATTNACVYNNNSTIEKEPAIQVAINRIHRIYCYEKGKQKTNSLITRTTFSEPFDNSFAQKPRCRGSALKDEKRLRERFLGERRIIEPRRQASSRFLPIHGRFPFYLFSVVIFPDGGTHLDRARPGATRVPLCSSASGRPAPRRSFSCRR